MQRTCVLLGALLTGSNLSAQTWYRDVDGDGKLDRIAASGDRLRIERNIGGGNYEVVPQELPRLGVQFVLAGELDAVGGIDLLLLGANRCVALVGEGSGRFRDATSELGIAGLHGGVSASLVDADGDGMMDILVDQSVGQVLVRGLGNGRFAMESTQQNDARSPQAEILATLAEIDRELAPIGGSRVVLRSLVQALTLSSSSSAWSTPQAATALPSTCSRTVADQASPGSCLTASSTPTLGMLHPLSQKFNVTPAGAIGIGTTLPLGEVTIAGTPSLDPYNYGHADLFMRAAGQALGFNIAATSDRLIFADSDGSFFGNIMTMMTTGQIGIGTTSPKADLHVQGNAAQGQGPHADFLLWAEGAPKGVNIAGVPDGLIVAMYDGSTYDDKLFLRSNGQMGLGVSSPQETLDVQGRVYARNGVRFSDGTVQTTAAVGSGFSFAFIGESPNASSLDQPPPSAPTALGQIWIDKEGSVDPQGWYVWFSVDTSSNHGWVLIY